MNQYALQELPLKRLQQQREDNGGHQVVECKSCGEQAGPVVAWCEECDAMICQQCSSQHEKMSILRGHVIKSIKKFRRSASESIAEINDNESCRNHVVKSKESELPCCPKHLREEMKYWCNRCSEVVCVECLRVTHERHKHSLVEKARHSFEVKMKKLGSLAERKKEEFSEYLEEADNAEGEAL